MVVEPSFLHDEIVKGTIWVEFHVQLQLVRPPLGVDELGDVRMMQPRKASELPFRPLLGLLVALVVVDRFAGDYLCSVSRSAYLAPRGCVRAGWGNRLIRYPLHFDHSTAYMVVVDCLVFRHDVRSAILLAGSTQAEFFYGRQTSRGFMGG